MKIKSFINELKDGKAFKVITLTSFIFNIVLAIFKAILSIFNGVILLTSALVSLFMGLAKYISYLGINNNDKDYQKRNILVSFLIFCSGLQYFVYMLLIYKGSFILNSYSFNVALLIALVSFIEIVSGIYGLFKLKEKGHNYKNIKIINFLLSLEALVLTETAILSFKETHSFSFYSSLFGMGVAIITILVSFYMFLSPFISITNREKNNYIFIKSEVSSLSNCGEILLKKSYIYGNYIYKYKHINKYEVEGIIEKEKGLFFKVSLPLKIILIILSEILIFVWLIGRFIYFLYSINMINKLDNYMKERGYIKIVNN